VSPDDTGEWQVCGRAVFAVLALLFAHTHLLALVHYLNHIFSDFLNVFLFSLVKYFVFLD